jgi:hypothetical protein
VEEVEQMIDQNLAGEINNQIIKVSIEASHL